MSKTKFITGLMLILILSQVYSIGISPPIRRLLFQPNMAESFEYVVLNENPYYIEARLYVKGDLAQYVELDRKSIKLKPGYTGTFSANLKLPSEIEEPGRHRILIGAEEHNPGLEGVGAVAAIQSPIDIDVPYPGKYLRWDIKADDVQENQPVVFKIEAMNRGKEKIYNAFARLDIYDYKNNLLQSLVTDAHSFDLDETKVLTGLWSPNPSLAGEYRVNATLFYDGVEKEKSGIFHIGKLFVELINITDEFIIDKIQPFKVNVRSNWNNIIPQVHAEIMMFDIGENLLASLKTPSEDLQPWKFTTLQTYWDTNNVKPGNYTADVTLLYSDQKQQKRFKIAVFNETKVPDQKLELTSTQILIIIIVLLTIFNFMWFLYSSKRSKDSKKRR